MSTTKQQYDAYAGARLAGDYAEMSSFRFVHPHLTGKKVLDVGCSDGLYLSKFSGGSVGIEQVPALAEAARKRGLNVIEGDVLDKCRSLAPASFEAVLFSHVIEHVDAPIQVLREINRILVQNGTLALGVPIERNVFRDALRRDYFDGTHIYAFSVRNARKLLEETAFVERALYFHLPKCRGRLGRGIETAWNSIAWPMREYFSMAYWIVAEKA